MMSMTEIATDPKSPYGCVVRKMEELNISEIGNINNLSGQYCWIHDYYEYEHNEKIRNKMLQHDKYCDGFNIDDVIMDVTFKDGYYLIEVVTNEPLSTVVTYDKGYGIQSVKTVTLKDAIITYLNGCLSDGVGENPIGYVTYNHTEHEVWLGELVEIH